MFPCEFCEISKNTFSYRTRPVTASEIYIKDYYDSFVYVTLNIYDLKD